MTTSLRRLGNAAATMARAAGGILASACPCRAATQVDLLLPGECHPLLVGSPMILDHLCPDRSTAADRSLRWASTLSWTSGFAAATGSGYDGGVAGGQHGVHRGPCRGGACTGGPLRFRAAREHHDGEGATQGSPAYRVSPLSLRRAARAMKWWPGPLLHPGPSQRPKRGAARLVPMLMPRPPTGAFPSGASEAPGAA